jgi:hypothetical protein
MVPFYERWPHVPDKMEEPLAGLISIRRGLQPVYQIKQFSLLFYWQRGYLTEITM